MSLIWKFWPRLETWPNCYKLLLWAVFYQAVSKQKKKQNLKKREIELELKKFKSMPNLDISENPLEWWEKSGKTLFLNLYKTAITYLIIPATLVPNERIFSSAGSILTKKRNRLGPQHAKLSSPNLTAQKMPSL